MNPGTIILHVGLFKTGSTAIQKSFFRARNALADHGVNYPGFSWNHGLALYPAFEPSARESAWMANVRLARGRLARAINEGYRRALAQALEDNDSPTLVLSGEHFSALSDDGVARLLDFLADYCQCLKVICYVRHPWPYATSLVQQLVREGAPLQPLLERPPFPPFRRVLEPYLKRLPPDQVDIRIFRRDDDRDWDVVDDFAAAVGLASDARPAPRSGDSNRRLSLSAILALDRVNRTFPGGVQNPGRALLLARSFEDLPGESFGLPTETLAKIRRAVRDDARWLVQALGCRPFRFDPPKQPGPAITELEIKAQGADDLALARNERMLQEQGEGARDLHRAAFVAFRETGRLPLETVHRAILSTGSAQDLLEMSRELEAAGCGEAAVWAGERAVQLDPASVTAMVHFGRLVAGEPGKVEPAA